MEHLSSRSSFHTLSTAPFTQLSSYNRTLPIFYCPACTTWRQQYRGTASLSTLKTASMSTSISRLSRKSLQIRHSRDSSSTSRLLSCTLSAPSQVPKRKDRLVRSYATVSSYASSTAVQPPPSPPQPHLSSAESSDLYGTSASIPPSHSPSIPLPHSTPLPPILSNRPLEALRTSLEQLRDISAAAGTTYVEPGRLELALRGVKERDGGVRLAGKCCLR